MLERINQYSYDELGRITSERFDGGADGVFERVTTYSYDDLLTGGATQTTVQTDSTASAETDLSTELGGSLSALGTSNSFVNNDAVASTLEDASILSNVEATDQFIII